MTRLLHFLADREAELAAVVITIIGGLIVAKVGIPLIDALVQWSLNHG